MKYDKLQEFDQLMNKFMDDGIAAGLNILVMTPTEKWFKCYGNRQVIPSVEATTMDTIWDLASISKVLSTTTCILKLIEEGLLTLDTKVKSVLPLLEDEDVTIRQLISHSSGFPADVDGYKAMTKAEMIEKIWAMKKVPEFIGRVHYSDVNFLLLGLVIEALKGSLPGYAKEVMFEPLHMVDTCYTPCECLKPRCAAYEDLPARGGVIRGTVHDGKGHKFEGIAGHAGVFSTIEDISHYVEMLLNDGVYHGKRFFSEETMNMLRTCNTVGMNESRSVGWILSDHNYPIGDYCSEHTLYHTGFSGPSLLIDLDKKFACVILCNRVHPTRDNKKILTARKDIHNAVYQVL